MSLGFLVFAVQNSLIYQVPWWEPHLRRLRVLTSRILTLLMGPAATALRSSGLCSLVRVYLSRNATAFSLASTTGKRKSTMWHLRDQGISFGGAFTLILSPCTEFNTKQLPIWGDRIFYFEAPQCFVQAGLTLVAIAGRKQNVCEEIILT